MLSPIYSFHHFGLATKNAQTSKSSLEAIGYRFGQAIYDPFQKVNLQISEDSNALPRIELVWEKEGVSSPLTPFLKSADACFYHICFECPDLKNVESELQTHGIRAIQITDISPAILFDNRRIVFYKVKNLGLVEFLERAEN